MGLVIRMTKRFLEQHGFNYEKGLARFKGQEHLYYDYVEQLLQSDLCDKAIDALRNNHYSDAQKYVDAYKTLILQSELTQLVEPVCELADAFEKGEAVSVFPKLLALKEQSAEVRQNISWTIGHSFFAIA